MPMQEMQEAWIQSWVRKIPRGRKWQPALCSLLACRLPWTEEPGRLHTVPGATESPTWLCRATEHKRKGGRGDLVWLTKSRRGWFGEEEQRTVLWGRVYLNMEVEGTSVKWRLGLAVAVQEMSSGSRPE